MFNDLDPLVQAAIFTGFCSIIVGLLAYIGGSKKAVTEAAVNKKLAQTEEDRTAVEGWQSLAQEYRADREVIRRDLQTLRTDLDDTRREVIELREVRQSDRRWKRLAAGYIEQLLAFIHTNLIGAATDLIPPTPPSGLDLTDPDLKVP